MSIFVGSSSFFPHLLKAKTGEGLQRKIKEMQTQKQAEFRFINFYYDGTNHCTWYYTEDNFKELINNEVNNEHSKK